MSAPTRQEVREATLRSMLNGDVLDVAVMSYLVCRDKRLDTLAHCAAEDTHQHEKFCERRQGRRVRK